MSSRVFKAFSSTCYSCFTPDLTRGRGGTQQSQSIADFTFAIGDRELSIPLQVVDLGQADLNLGMDLLAGYVSQLELTKGLMTLTDGSENELFHKNRSRSK